MREEAGWHNGEMTGRIAVVGSANLDIVVPVERHPGPGETVMGEDHSLIPGGKGANQAVAASRLGGSVSFLGAVGDDAAGAQLAASLQEAGVDITNLREVAGTPSGIALIAVGTAGEHAGDNAIVVSPGANAAVSAAQVTGATELLSDAAVVLLQLEVPMDAVTAAATAATGTVVLNPAPAAELPASLLAAVDILIPNESEVAILGTGSTVEEQARSLPTRTVVVTLGAQGALIVTEDDAVAVPSPVVTPVDTTGAGDSFCGAVATELAAGRSLLEAVQFAVQVGAATTLKLGAQSSLPTRQEVAARLS